MFYNWIHRWFLTWSGGTHFQPEGGGAAPSHSQVGIRQEVRVEAWSQKEGGTGRSQVRLLLQRVRNEPLSQGEALGTSSIVPLMNRQSSDDFFFFTVWLTSSWTIFIKLQIVLMGQITNCFPPVGFPSCQPCLVLPGLIPWSEKKQEFWKVALAKSCEQRRPCSGVCTSAFGGV